MALVTGTGGGIMRSILMGASPPPVFVDPVYIIIAGVATPGASLFHGLWDKFRREISVMDALGLGVFVCIGTHIAIDHGLAWWAARWHGSCGSYLWGVIRARCILQQCVSTAPFCKINTYDSAQSPDTPVNNPVNKYVNNM